MKLKFVLVILLSKSLMAFAEPSKEFGSTSRHFYLIHPLNLDYETAIYMDHENEMSMLVPYALDYFENHKTEISKKRTPSRGIASIKEEDLPAVYKFNHWGIAEAKPYIFLGK